MKKIGLFLLLLCSTSMVYAEGQTIYQTATNQDKYTPTFGTRIYFNWHTDIMNKKWDSTEQDTVTDKNQNSFAIERVYFDFNKKLDENWLIRATLDVMSKEDTASAVDSTDISGMEYETDGHSHGPKSTTYEAFLKFAYAEGNYTLYDGLTVTMRAGMIDSPITGYLDKLADSRWIQNNMILQYKKMLPGGYRIDNSADLGASLELAAKLGPTALSLTGGVVNGEGFKNVQEDDNDGKAYYGRLVFKPADMIQIFTYGRYEIQKSLSTEDSNWKDDFEYLYGGGMAISTDMVKIGASYTRPVKQTAGEFVHNSDGNKQQLHLFDQWLHLNFASAGLPVLIYQRAGYGVDRNLDNATTEVMHAGFGLGYQFTKGIRTIAFYDSFWQDDDSEKFQQEQTFYLKAEFTF